MKETKPFEADGRGVKKSASSIAIEGWAPLLGLVKHILITYPVEGQIYPKDKYLFIFSRANVWLT